MKQSIYNFFYESEFDDKLIAYNSRTNCLALIEKERYAKIEPLLANEYDDNELFEDLKRGGFIVDEKIDEKDIIRYERNCQRYNTAALGLTIAPTLGCNFNCVYCFESSQNNHTKMSKEIQDILLEFIQRRIKTLSQLNITWFGGEPLLAFDVIESLSTKIIELCEKNEVTYFASIITNGYFLTKEIACKMKDLKINMAQVTLDGTRDVHDSRRKLFDGAPTFDKILKNLEDVIDIYPNISLRVNTDVTNKEKVFEILDVIKNSKLDKKIIPYLGAIYDANDCYKKDSCLAVTDFLELDFDFDEEAKKRGYITNVYHKYPQQFRALCGADRYFCFVIDPYGNVCKCWSELGMSEYYIGNIAKDMDLTQRLLQYSLYDVFSDEKCSNCKVLPLCMGGCPEKRINNKERCTSYKYMLEKRIKVLAKDIKIHKDKQDN